MNIRGYIGISLCVCPSVFPCILVSGCVQNTGNFVLQTPLNAFPNKPWFLPVYSISCLKKLREKEK